MKCAVTTVALGALLTACGATGPVVDVATFDATDCDSSSPASNDPTAAMRASCAFGAGSLVAQTLGISASDRAAIPVTHVMILMQENRSFDHYFGRLALDGQPDAEGFPPTFTNPDLAGVPVSPWHLDTTCVATDPPHQWDAMHAAWDMGAMDGFVRTAAVDGSDGHYVMGYYDARDLPFYAWLASTFAISDRYFASALGGTWANRDYLYAGNSYGVQDTDQRTIAGEPTLFDELDAAGVRWGVYTDAMPRQVCLGWDARHRGVETIDDMFALLQDGTLPPVAFVDPQGSSDEHPPGDVQRGEARARQIYLAARESPLWPQLAVIYTYDESGGFFDHVPPPPACIAAPDQAQFDRLGFRVPFVIASPWARAGFVSHRVHEHASVLRFIELLHDLPALSARDANADALLDLFDFSCPHLANPPLPPLAGAGGCP